MGKIGATLPPDVQEAVGSQWNALLFGEGASYNETNEKHQSQCCRHQSFHHLWNVSGDFETYPSLHVTEMMAQL